MDGKPVTLTQKEFELVEALLERPGAAVSRQQLMDRIWGDAFVAVSRTLDVHMTGLRAKLNRPGLIATAATGTGGGREKGEPGCAGDC